MADPFRWVHHGPECKIAANLDLYKGKAMEESGVRLAIIRQPRVGVYAHGGKHLSLFFTAWVSETSVADLIVPLPSLPPGVKFDVSGLEGEPCWVDYDPLDRKIKFVKWWSL